jgi:peptidoglycan/LPS O-acetylase OafA/YrhL
MPTSNELSPGVRSELARRHGATAKTIKSLIVAVVLLCVLAFVSKKFLTERSSPSLEMIVNITIVVFGFGAITLRRTKFARMRLQDIGALQGASGLLATLQRTTLLVALIGIAIAIIGFIATLVSGTPFYMYKAGVIAVAVLLYCYPVRSAWEKAVKQFCPPNGVDPPENAA